MDRRTIVGTIVKAKGYHVVDKSECGRRFGSLSGSTEVYGVVKEVICVPNIKTGCFATAIKAEYNIAGEYK